MSWNLGDPTARTDWKAEHLPSDRGRKVTKAEKAERAQACLEAVRDYNRAEARRYVEMDLKPWYLKPASARNIAHYIGVKPAQQLGNGAKDGRSWSGSMNPALRVAPTLKALAKRGELVQIYGSDGDDRYRYYVPGEEPRQLYDRYKAEAEGKASGE